MERISTPADQTSANWAIYTGAAAYYQSTRPGYPLEVIHLIISLLPDVDTPVLAIDVGCGTGIFSRLVADVLDKSDRVIGVEPNDDMRREAMEASRSYENLEFVPGSSEDIPIDDGKAMLVSAASAAHWFDLKRYYTEVARVLRPEGIIAFIQNKRRWWDSELLSEYESFHERFVPGYMRGTFPDRFGGFGKETFLEDLGAHSSFIDCRQSSWVWSRTLTKEDFETLSLSTSHTRRALVDNDAAIVMAELRRILERGADAEGKIEISYVTEVTTAVRTTVRGRG